MFLTDYVSYCGAILTGFYFFLNIITLYCFSVEAVLS